MRGPMEVVTAVDISSDMIRKVLRNSCSRAAERLAPSMATVLKCNEPKTVAAMTATCAVASSTSTSVKASSESSRRRKYIGAGLQHFIGRSLLPENLNFYFANGREGCRRNDALPWILFSPIRHVARHLVAWRRITEITGGFSDRIDRTELCLGQFLLSTNCWARS